MRSAAPLAAAALALLPPGGAAFEVPLPGLCSVAFRPAPSSRAGAGTCGAGAGAGRRRSSPGASPALASSPEGGDGAPDPEDEEEATKFRLEEIRSSLAAARARRDAAESEADEARRRRDEVRIESDEIVAELRQGISEAVTNLSDRIEGAQDSLRTTASETRSKISAVRTEARERESKLKSEIAELESRLESLRLEAYAASGERDRARDAIREDERKARSEARKELDAARSDSRGEKKSLTREKWALETRIARAEADVAPANRALEEGEREELPLIASLKDKFDGLRDKFRPRIDELKEEKNAGEMFFDKSLNDLKGDKREEIRMAKSVSEGEMAEEDARLANATRFYDGQLEEREGELRRVTQLASEPLEPLGAQAAAEAKQSRLDLYREKFEAAWKQGEDREDALRNAVESQEALRDQYDAELEDARWDLQQQGDSARRRLEREDMLRTARGEQLRSQREDVARELSRLMRKEATASEVEYDGLTRSKAAELAKAEARIGETSDRIRKTRGDLMLAKDQLLFMEEAAARNGEALRELEEEQGSFRKQARRTLVAAVGRFRRRGGG